MNVPPEKLLEEIGRLHVANAVLTEHLAASRQELLKLTADKAAESETENDTDTD